MEGLWGDHHSLPEAHFPQTSSLFTPEALPGTKSHKLGGPSVLWQKTAWTGHAKPLAQTDRAGVTGRPGLPPLGRRGLWDAGLSVPKGAQSQTMWGVRTGTRDPNFSSPSTPQMSEK